MKFRVIFIVLISTITIYSQSAVFQRTIGFGGSYGMNFISSHESKIENNNVINFHITNYFPLNSYSTSFGVMFSYSNGYVFRNQEFLSFNDYNWYSTTYENEYKTIMGGFALQLHPSYTGFSFNIKTLFGIYQGSYKMQSTEFFGDLSGELSDVAIFYPSVGFSIWLSRGFSLDIEGGYVIPINEDNFDGDLFDLRAGISLYYVATYDDDGDGVPNDDDVCPNTPSDELVNPLGCSESQIDSDADGVNDKFDECPNTLQGDIVDEFGCSSSQKDSDMDGITDNIDQCPDTPQNEKANEFGCSDSQLDSDKDGIPDKNDKCNDTPQGEIVNDDGCSETQLDRDSDSIPDSEDECPDLAESYNFYMDTDGCPDNTEYYEVYAFNPNVPVFENKTANISVDVKGSIEVDLLYLFTDYPETYWIVYVTDPQLAEQKAKTLKQYIDERLGVSTRTVIEFEKGTEEKIELKLNKKKAHEIATKRY